ncbi:unnamed protein product [Caenorhabditis angaria]|uniref:FBA domain-containing protein n=1 Tax=Caenorhabditis angaria TaxID=860376 RepID=A0A9P1ICZ4_9PELO|nr:unnamed protein product [Caenorhabditis angaria]
MADDVCFDAFFHVFLVVDNETLENLNKTCRKFRNIIKRDAFWIQRAEYFGKQECLPSKKWRIAANSNKFQTDSISADQSSEFKFNFKKMVLDFQGYGNFEPYQIDHRKDLDYHSHKYNMHFNGDDGIVIEENGIGCEADPSVPACFALTYFRCDIDTVIDFKQIGIDDWILDHVRPKIRITQKVNHRFDCGSFIRIKAKLSNNSEFYEVHGTTEKSWRQWEAPCNWENLILEIENYASGMRFLKVRAYGRDSQRWAGNYGPKIGKLQIKIILPEEPVIDELKDRSESEYHDSDE